MSPKSDEGGAAGGEDPQERAVPRLPGGRKRDTMIRELKSKLKEKFPTNTLAVSSHSFTTEGGSRVTKPQFRYKYTVKKGTFSPKCVVVNMQSHIGETISPNMRKYAKILAKYG